MKKQIIIALSTAAIVSFTMGSMLGNFRGEPADAVELRKVEFVCRYVNGVRMEVTSERIDMSKNFSCGWEDL